MTERMAYEVDLDNPYITLDNNYIESVWWILNKFNKEGYMYEGHKILPCQDVELVLHHTRLHRDIKK